MNRNSMLGRGTLAILLASVLALFAGQALAQTVRITLGEHDEHGPLLTDEDGRAVYLFENEAFEGEEDEFMTEGVREAAAACTGGCLEQWPPVEAGEVEAVGDVDAAEGADGFRSELLYVEEVDGRMQVVYNGWPLYYFAGDETAEDRNGHGLGGDDTTWYLVNPLGAPASPGLERPDSDEEGGADADADMDGDADVDGEAEAGDDADAADGEADMDGEAGADGDAADEEQSEGDDDSSAN